MLLEPGPLDLIDPAALALEPEPAVFEALERENEAAIDALTAELGGQVTTLWAVAEQEPDASLAGEIELAQAELAAELSEPVELGEGELQAAGQEVTQFILDTYEEVPAEAWLDRWTPFVPLPEINDFTPAPDPDPSLIQLPPPAVLAATVTLANLSRPGAVDFGEAEDWEIQITGPPSAPVEVSAWKDGIDLGSETVGFTDTQGRFALRGSMGAEHIGSWTEVWTVGGIVASPMLSFDVVDVVTIVAAVSAERLAAPTPPGVVGTTPPAATGGLAPEAPPVVGEVFRPAGVISPALSGVIEWASRDVLAVEIRVLVATAELYRLIERPIGVVQLQPFGPGQTYKFELWDFSGGERGKLLDSRSIGVPAIVLAPWVVWNNSFFWSNPPTERKITYETQAWPAGELAVAIDGAASVTVIRTRMVTVYFSEAWRNRQLLFTLYSLTDIDPMLTRSQLFVDVDLRNGQPYLELRPIVNDDWVRLLGYVPQVAGQRHSTVFSREIRWE